MAQKSHKWIKALFATIVAATTCLASDNAMADDAVLEIEGMCPGQVRISWRESVPDRRAGLVFGEIEGTFVIPSGIPCAGLELGVARRVQWVRTVQSDSNGVGMANGYANRSACGGFLQLVFSTPRRPCQTSNVVQVPN